MKSNRTLCLLLALILTWSAILSAVVILPAAEEPAGATGDIGASHPYVADGLVALYDGQNHGTSDTVWEDLVGENDLTINQNDKNYFTDSGLAAEGTKHHFPSGIVDVVNGQEFTVELLFGEFISLGTDYNTFLNSSNDNFALFRRNGTNQLEFKFAANPGDQRHKIDDGLNLLQSSLITITYKVGGTCYIYVNGVLMAEKPSPSAMGANDLFIGHDSAQKTYNTTYRSMRFYSRALTAEEVKANARADGYKVPEGNDPALETPGYVTVAQPKTNIIGDISMVRRINTADEFSKLIAAEQKPAVAIYRINASLDVLSDKGAAISSVPEILSATEFKILSAFLVENTATADALAAYLKDIAFYDCFVVSADPAVVEYFRKLLPTVSGVIDFTATYKDATALTEAQCLEIRRVMKEQYGTIAVLPAALCTQETVQYLYERQVNVWVSAADMPSQKAQYNALLSGAIGVVSDATDSLLDIACNQLPASTMTRVATNVGHRGIPSQAPENTLEGSILAFESGANVIELDIYITIDGKVVVMHDGTTGRTCDKDLSVEGSTLAQLKELYVNKGYESSADFAECRIPTLEEYLAYFKGKDCNLFIEIKSTKREIIAATKTLIDEYDMYGQCTVITFHQSILQYMREDYPEMHGGYLCGDIMSGTGAEAGLRSAMNAIGSLNATINPSAGGYDEADLRAALQRGISIFPWTFRGDFSVYKSYFLWGYTGLTGDNANELGKYPADVTYTIGDTFLVGESLPLSLDVTTYARETNAKNASTYIILSGTECVDSESNKFIAAGEVTLVLGYRQRITRTEEYTLLSQPITITVTEPATDPQPDTEPETDPATEPVGTDTTPADTDPTTDKTDTSGGCASTVALASVALLTLLCALPLRKKNKQD